MPVKLQVAAHGHRPTPIEAEQDVSHLNGFTVYDFQVGNAARCRRVDRLEFITAQFAADCQFFCEGAGGNGLGYGSVPQGINSCPAIVPWLPHGQASHYRSSHHQCEDSHNQPGLHGCLPKGFIVATERTKSASTATTLTSTRWRTRWRTAATKEVGCTGTLTNVGTVDLLGSITKQ